MKLIVALTFLIIFTTQKTYAEESASEQKIIYKYKQYETIDLGGLEIKGNIIAPGDISVKERDRKEFERKLLNRHDFDLEIKEDIRNLR